MRKSDKGRLRDLDHGLDVGADEPHQQHAQPGLLVTQGPDVENRFSSLWGTERSHVNLMSVIFASQPTVTTEFIAKTDID